MLELPAPERTDRAGHDALRIETDLHPAHLEHIALHQPAPDRLESEAQFDGS